MTLCSRLTFGLVCLCLIFLLLKPVFMLSGPLRFAMRQNTPILVQALVRDTHVRTHILNTPIQHTTKQHTQHTHTFPVPLDWRRCDPVVSSVPCIHKAVDSNTILAAS